MPTQEALEARRKPIGDVALEVLVGMAEGKWQFAAINWSNRVFRDSIIRSFDPVSFVKNEGMLSASAKLRIETVLAALLRREYVALSSQNVYLEAAASTTKKGKFTQKQADKIGELFSKRNLFRSSEAEVNVYTITADGKQAVADMKNRVKTQKEEKQAATRYLAAAQVVDREHKAGTSGIFQIDRETKDRFFIFPQPVRLVSSISNKFNDAIHYNYSASNSRVSFILKRDVIAVSDNLNALNTLVDEQENYNKAIAVMEAEANSRINEIRAKADVLIDKERAELREDKEATLYNFSQKTEEILKQFTEQEKLQRENDDVVTFEDDEVESIFKP